MILHFLLISVSITSHLSSHIIGDYQDIIVEDGYIYAATIRGLEILEKSGKLIASWGSPGKAHFIQKNDSLIFLGDREGKVHILAPKFKNKLHCLSTISVDMNINQLSLFKDYLIIAGDSGIKVYDVKTTTLAFSLKIENGCLFVLPYKDFLYAAIPARGIVIFKFIPSTKTLLKKEEIPITQNVLVIEAHNNLLYVGKEEGGFEIIELNKKMQIKARHTKYIPGIIKDIEKMGNLLLVASDENGFFVFDVHQPKNISLKSQLKEAVGATKINSSKTEVYLACGKNGIAIIDLSKPSLPLIKEFLRDKKYSVWDVTIFNGDKKKYYGALALGKAGVGLFELQKDSVLEFERLKVEDARRIIFQNKNLIALNYGYGVKIFEPLSYTYFTSKHSFDISGELKDVAISGDYLLVASKEGLKILNVCLTCPSRPLISKVTYPGNIVSVSTKNHLAILAKGKNLAELINFEKALSPKGIASSNWGEYISDALIHNSCVFLSDTAIGIWVMKLNLELVRAVPTPPILSLEVSDNLLLAACGYEGIKLFDISDPFTPKLIAEYDTPGYARMVYKKDQYLFVADTYSLEVLKISF